MEKFRETIRKRKYMFAIVVLGLVIANIILMHFGNSLTEHKGDFFRGYQGGLAGGLSAVAISYIVKYAKAEKNDELLKKLYIAETDERTLLIHQKSGSLGMFLVIWILLVASIIAGYYNFTVFVTLLVAALLVGVVRIALKIYYNSKC